MLNSKPLFLNRFNRVDPLRVLDPLRDIGRGDLDPFGRGGGMLFNPPGMPFQPSFPGNLPPAGIVPGARFDPFSPPQSGGRPNPNNDHFRPPGFDDMFM